MSESNRFMGCCYNGFWESVSRTCGCRSARKQADWNPPGIIGSDGEPSNDMPMVGVFGRYRIRDVWFIGFASLEREFMQHSDTIRPFLSASIGIGVIDVPDVVVPLQGGGEADITTDAGNEIIPGVSAGVRFHYRNGFFLEPAMRFQYHMAEWDVKDRNTNKSTTVDDYTTWGGYVGIGWSF